MSFHKILLTSDLSDESERAFAPVAELARMMGASITLFHVVYDVAVAPHGAPLAPPVHPPDIQEQVEEARQALARHRAKLPEDLAVDVDVLSADNVARAVADYAQEHGHDLIALSTHGRTGFRRLVLGSVAEAVIRHSHVPVLVFPRQE